MKRAITTHLKDFVAIILLLLLSIGVAGYILTQEGLRLPFIAKSQYTLNAAFQTAQAVTPGQGQTVRISGVQIGNIVGVKLVAGHAVVRLAIDDKYRNVIHTDATGLLRPRTGLDDMFIELNPGSTTAPRAKTGFTIPIDNTLPDINPDEVLASLDADTRAYLQLLIDGAGQGLKHDGGNQLAMVFKKFEPTHRDLARLNKAVAVRGTNLQRLINSLQRLNTALAQKQPQIVQLVDSADRVFTALGNDDKDISRAIADLPGTLRQTTATLAKVQRLAVALGPAATNLLPFAHSLPAANLALQRLAVPATPIVKNQIRPFITAARPVIRNLKPAAVNLAKATPNLATTFNVFNHLVNLLAYYPTGAGEHGYLWWLAWLDHNARTLFSIQDANGDYRPLFLQASCQSLTGIAQNLPGSAALLNLTPILSSAGLCPAQASQIAADYSQFKAGRLSKDIATGGAPGAAGVKFFPKLAVK